MRIRRFISRGFGCLPEGFEWEFAPSGLTIVLGNNEIGKSTLVEGILAGLYGDAKVSSKKVKQRLRPISAFAPWGQPEEKPKLSLEVETTHHGLLTIHRDFGSKSKSVQVVETGSRLDRTREFQQDRKTYRIGETLIGLSRSTFEKTALLLQSDLQAFESDPDLVQAIESVVNSGELGTTAQAALESLKRAERQEDPTRKTMVHLSTVLSRLSERVQVLEDEETRLKQDYEAYQQEIKTLEHLQETLDSLALTLDNVRSRLAQAEYQEAKRALEKHHVLMQERESLQQQLAELVGIEDFPIHLQAQIEDLESQRQEIKRRMESLNSEIGQLSQEVDTQTRMLAMFPWPMDTMPWDRVNALIQKRTDCKVMYQSAKQTLEDEFERLAKQGIDISCLRRALGYVVLLPPDQSNLLGQLLLQSQESHRSELTQAAASVSRKKWLRSALLMAGLLLLASALVEMPMLGVRVALGIGMLLLGIIFQWFLSQAVAQEKSLRDALNHQLQAFQEHYPWITKPGVLADLTWFYVERHQAFSVAEVLRGKLQLREQDLRDVLSELGDLLQRPMNETLDLDACLAASEPMIEQYQSFYMQFQQYQEAIRCWLSKQKDYERAEETLKSLEQSMSSLFKQAGIEARSNWDAMLTQFKDGINRYLTHQQLNTKMLEFEQAIRSPQELQALQDQLSRYDEFHELPCPDDLASVAEERNRFHSVEMEYNAVKDSMASANKIIVGKRDRFHREYPVTVQNLNETRELLLRYQEFGDALVLAQNVLEEVSQKEYDQWSQRLNGRVASVLKSFRAPYQDIRFTQTLAFTLFDQQNREYSQASEFPSLSCGTRDQIYLAIRLAITDYLAQDGGHLPLILDDPFVNFDDERFFYALETLVKAGTTGRQVLLFSCHGQRHRDAFEMLMQVYPGAISLCQLDHGISIPHTKVLMREFLGN